MPYLDAFAVQVAVHADVLAGDSPPTVLLVEHEPVITVSRRPGAAAHVLADRARLAELGIDLQPTNRGGDVTYHGPGQLVAYPIVPLQPLGLTITTWMRLLEQVIIDTLRSFDIAARRVERCTGVWVGSSVGETAGDETACSNKGLKKIAALGVRLRRGVTMHGLAVNVATDLSHFETIVPCGLANRNVTSMQQQLDREVAMDDVKQTLSGVMRGHVEACAAAAI